MSRLQMPTGSDLLSLARAHIGEKYVNRLVPKDDASWKGPWDCAEFMSWLVYQCAGKLYGCVDNSAPPRTAEAYTGAWQRDSQKLGKRVSVQEAASTVGAFLLRYPPGPGKMGHIALSDGKGGTVEAAGRKLGVVAGKVNGRRWDTGVLVPGIEHDEVNETLSVVGPAILYGQDAPNMSADKVAEIQRTLAGRGYDVGAIDGEFGERTRKAVAAFQDDTGLIVDGEVGGTTAQALGVSLVGTVLQAAAAVLPLALGGGVGSLIAIAAAVLPEIVKFIAGDRSGAVTTTVAKAVSDAAGTSDPAAAQAKIKSDPTAAYNLQVRLAEIALEQEKARQQASLAEMRAEREADLARTKAELADTADARLRAAEYSRLGGPMQWGAPLVSLVVTLGFFVTLVILIRDPSGLRGPGNENVLQLVNIIIGALAAAFATVVSFWLGSSQGSRLKDVANVGLQREQAQQNKELIRAQGTTMEAARQAISAPRAPASGPVAAPPPKMSNFQNCVDITLVHEGGFSNDPADPGGATQFGITLATLKRWRHPDGVDVEDVRRLEKTEACEIYRTQYWNVLRCDDLPVGVDLAVFDIGVNAGPSRAAKFLQKIIGAEADGSVGPATIASAKALDPKIIVNELSQARLDHYRGLAHWDKFKNGWTRRTNSVTQAALQMIEASRSRS